LDSLESIAKFKADPVAFVDDAGGTLAHLDDRSLTTLRNYLATIEVPEPTPGLLTELSFRCTGCKMAVAATAALLTGAIAAVIAFAIGGTGGADAAAAPAEAVAGASAEMAVIGAETALPATVVAATTTGVLESWVTWAAANKVAAVALAASGAAGAELLGDIIDAICERAGACSS
jgi:hypothetical protein